MKSAPASIASQDARATLSRVASSPVSRITFRWAGAARLAHGRGSRRRPGRSARRGTRRGRSPCRSRRRRRSTASRTSASLTAQRRPAGGERGRHRRRRATVLPASASLGDADQVGVDADRRHRRDGRVGRVGPAGLGAHRPHLARRVGALEGRQVDHPDGRVERPQLGVPLDRAGRQRGGPRARRRPGRRRAGRAGPGAAPRRVATSPTKAHGARRRRRPRLRPRATRCRAREPTCGPTSLTDDGTARPGEARLDHAR